MKVVVTSAPLLLVLRWGPAARTIPVRVVIVPPTISVVVIIVTIVEVRLILVVPILVFIRVVLVVIIALLIGLVVTTAHSTVVPS